MFNGLKIGTYLDVQRLSSDFSSHNSLLRAESFAINEREVRAFNGLDKDLQQKYRWPAVLWLLERSSSSLITQPQFIITLRILHVT